MIELSVDAGLAPKPCPGFFAGICIIDQYFDREGLTDSYMSGLIDEAGTASSDETIEALFAIEYGAEIRVLL